MTFSSKDEATLIPLLARKSYHLPGNTWRQDWVQWLRNNHIIVGICLHHPYHPIERWERIIVLLGSMSFALVTINIYYLLSFVNNPSISDFDPSEVLYTLSSGNGGPNYTITAGMAGLWIVGGVFHSMFDVVVWQAAACSWFHPGGRCHDRCPRISHNCKDCGSYALIPVVLSVMALAGYACYVRVNTFEDETDDDDSTTTTTSYATKDDDVYTHVTGGALGQYSFLLKYVIELLCSWFFFWPLVGTAFFCCGRPIDKARYEKAAAERVYGGHHYSSF